MGDSSRMTLHRFFAAPEEVYELVRTTLDSSWSLPNEKGTRTCMRAASDNAPRDAHGRIMVCVHSDWCNWEPAASMLPQLLGSGMIEEIDEAKYLQELPQIPVQ